MSEPSVWDNLWNQNIAPFGVAQCVRDAVGRGRQLEAEVAELRHGLEITEANLESACRILKFTDRDLAQARAEQAVLVAALEEIGGRLTKSDGYFWRKGAPTAFQAQRIAQEALSAAKRRAGREGV